MADISLCKRKFDGRTIFEMTEPQLVKLARTNPELESEIEKLRTRHIKRDMADAKRKRAVDGEFGRSNF